MAAPVVSEPGSADIRPNGSEQTTLSHTLQALLEETFGFKLTVRTFTYILKRLDEFGCAGQPQSLFRKIFTKNRLQKFRTILREILNREAFADKSKRNVDAINAVNFALFDEIQGSRVAQEGLRAALKWRKER